MSREVFCIKYKKNLPGLEKQPFPGSAGEHVYQNVSQQAWQEWLKHQTLLINEKHLQLMDPKTQTYLSEQRRRFLNNEDFDHAEGYTPTQDMQ